MNPYPLRQTARPRINLGAPTKAATLAAATPTKAAVGAAARPNDGLVRGGVGKAEKWPMPLSPLPYLSPTPKFGGYTSPVVHSPQVHLPDLRQMMLKNHPIKPRVLIPYSVHDCHRIKDMSPKAQSNVEEILFLVQSGSSHPK